MASIQRLVIPHMQKVKIVQLDPIFRQKTSIVYPPFKKGRYLEEYFYEYVTTHTFSYVPSAVYIPAFWTNIMINPTFSRHAVILQHLLDQALKVYPSETHFFTVCQHDDGPIFRLPKNTVIFGACTGDIPIPLIYEDTENRLISRAKDSADTVPANLASFVGTITHPVRSEMAKYLVGRDGVDTTIQTSWTNIVSDNNAKRFIESSLASRFVISPRGYGRSSFRYFEALLLDRIPVYIWDDIEWLPYKEMLDYSKFAVSVHVSNINTLYDRLSSIKSEEYVAMREEAKRHAHWFTLEGMSRYILSKAYNEDVSQPPHPFSIVSESSVQPVGPAQ